MTVKELKDFLDTLPDDFTVNFSFCEPPKSGEKFMTCRTFTIDKKSIDIGHSSKVVSLGGEED